MLSSAMLCSHSLTSSTSVSGEGRTKRLTVASRAPTLREVDPRITVPRVLRKVRYELPLRQRLLERQRLSTERSWQAKAGTPMQVCVRRGPGATQLSLQEAIG